MIGEKTITDLIDSYLEDKDLYLVEMKLSTSNRIQIEIDGPEGVNIKECVRLSRHIEGSLDREEDDFELQVSSPGLDQPFKVYQQYLKNEGREVMVKLNDAREFQGTLMEVNEEGFKLETKSKERIEGKKKKQIITTVVDCPFKDVTTTKIVISFK